jgi:hypothetical protein
MALKRQKPRSGHHSAWILIYLLSYFAASSLDLWTTALVLRTPGGYEANVYVAPGQNYHALNAWAVTLAAGGVMAALFAFGVANANLVSRQWLREPVRSLRKAYLNPFSRKLIDRSPLHAMAWALAFIVLRLLAALNNWMIAAGTVGPIGKLLSAVAMVTSPAVSFVVVAGGLFILLMVVMLPVAARLMMFLRAHEGRQRMP